MKAILVVFLSVLTSLGMASAQEAAGCADRQMSFDDRFIALMEAENIPQDAYDVLLPRIENYLIENVSDCILLGDALRDRFILNGNAGRVDAMFSAARSMLDSAFWKEPRVRKNRAKNIRIMLDVASQNGRIADAVALFEDEFDIFLEPEIEGARMPAQAYAKLDRAPELLKFAKASVQKADYFSDLENRPARYTDESRDELENSTDTLLMIAEILTASKLYSDAVELIFPSVKQVELGNIGIASRWFYAAAMEEVTDPVARLKLVEPLFEEIVIVNEVGYISPERMELIHASMARIAHKAGQTELQGKVEKSARRKYNKNFDTETTLKRHAETMHGWLGDTPPYIEQNASYTPAEVIGAISPNWPWQVPYAESGECEARFIVNKKGRAKNVIIECSDERFRASAVNAIKRARWRPAKKDGKPTIQYSVVLPVTYEGG